MSRRLSRRRFLQAGGTTGLAAWAAPLFVPSRVFGANERVGIGSIGVGNRGSGLARDFAKRARVAAIADVYLPRAHQVAESVGATHVYQDYRQLLEHREIDTVVVAPPRRWHALNCIHAAQAGKDIYCEKPQTYSIPEGRRMVQAVRKYQRVFQTGSQQRSGHNEYTSCMTAKQPTSS